MHIRESARLMGSLCTVGSGLLCSNVRMACDPGAIRQSLPRGSGSRSKSASIGCWNSREILKASGNARRAELEDAPSLFLRLAPLNTSEGWAKRDQSGQLLRRRITHQAMVAHFHNRDGTDPFRQQHLWPESYVECLQGKAHLLLQGLQPGENDGTEWTAEEAVKIHRNGRGGRIGMRQRNGSELIRDPPVAEKARDVWEEIKERPAQAGHTRHPQQADNPLALISEIRQANGVSYPGERKTGNIALLFLELRVHWYLHAETTATQVRSNTRKVTKEFRGLVPQRDVCGISHSCVYPCPGSRAG